MSASCEDLFVSWKAVYCFERKCFMWKAAACSLRISCWEKLIFCFAKNFLLFCEKWLFVLYDDSHCHKLICHWTAVLHLEHWHTGSYRYSDVAVVESTHKAMFVPFKSFLLSIVIINSHYYVGQKWIYHTVILQYGFGYRPAEKNQQKTSYF